MRISLNWINDYIDIKNENKKELADKITNAGVNVEKIEENNLNNLVVGLVKSCEKHPDSDHLNVCQIDVGKETLQIICGAPNIKKNQKVIVALIGATLPGDFEIKQREVRGIQSNGMVCALYELGLADKEKTYNEGIYVLNSDAIVGDNALNYLSSDTIYELDLNPNRSDCLSHLGFAYEVGAVLGKRVILPEISYHEIDESIKEHFSLNVNTENCNMYQAKMVKNVKIGPSPKFIKERLEAVGLRSINNVVDISNYVMLEYGQPLHFFDRDKLGDSITVRMAKESEKVVTIDEEERTLNENDIVISNINGVVAVAGVMGALNTDIDENTKNVLIESAIFNPYNVRYTSINLGLRSDSSLRFEKGLNYEYTTLAIERACYLLEKYADGKVLKDKIIYDKVVKDPKICDVSLEKIEKILGIKIPKEEIDKIFNRLNFEYEFNNDVYTVTIPNRCMDIFIKEDLIEEIGRLYGYDKLENKVLIKQVKEGQYIGNIKVRKDISKRLRTLGLNEVKTYTLVGEREKEMFKSCNNIKLLMPMSNDKSYVRTTLIPSLLNVYNYNKARNIDNINIYEISNVYENKTYEEETKITILMSGSYINNYFEGINIKVNYYTLKGIVENLLNYLGYKNRYSFEKNEDITDLHPGISATIYIDKEKIGFIGKVNPTINKNDIYVCELSLNKMIKRVASKIKFPNISKYPEIKKDVAFVLDKNIMSSDVKKEIEKQGSKLLKNIEIFDLYVGENIENNKKSLAFSLTFVSEERTLMEEEVEMLFRNIIDKVNSKFNAKIRDK